MYVGPIMFTPRDPEHQPSPTLLRAALSYFVSLAMVVGLLLVVGFGGSWRARAASPVLAGTFVPRSADTAPAFTFVGEDQVEVQAGEQDIPAFYRVEGRHVFIETANAAGPNQSWSFEIAGDRLIGGGVVLSRR